MKRVGVLMLLAATPAAREPGELSVMTRNVIFTSTLPFNVHANVIGLDPEDRTAGGLWPSDHAGVVARLLFGDMTARSALSSESCEPHGRGEAGDSGV